LSEVSPSALISILETIPIIYVTRLNIASATAKAGIYCKHANAVITEDARCFLLSAADAPGMLDHAISCARGWAKEPSGLWERIILLAGNY
jgi:hypothetical protein